MRPKLGMGARFRDLRRCLAVGLLISFLSAAAAAADPVQASGRFGSGAVGPTQVRVLVHEGEGPIQIGPVGSARTVVASHGNLISGGELLGMRWSPEGEGPWQVGSRVVRGQIQIRSRGDELQVLNRVRLEEYVASTVGGEMSASWPVEALRAQAVATRTYVLYEAAKRRGSDWDVRATVASQVYRGVETESEETRAATRATEGKVLTYHGQPILAVFHSTAGGRTATAGEVWGRDLPYLRIVDVEEEDEAPHTYWRTVFSEKDLRRVISSRGIDVGRIDGIEVTGWTASGRVAALEVRGDVDRAELRGKRLRSFAGDLGLRSKLFDIRNDPKGFAFVGSGFGHGVGMSQWGARAMAERGEPYERILAQFYPGTRLEQWSGRNVASRAPFVSTVVSTVASTAADGKWMDQRNPRAVESALSLANRSGVEGAADPSGVTRER